VISGELVGEIVNKMKMDLGLTKAHSYFDFGDPSGRNGTCLSARSLRGQ
jgi:hypothetical protein